MSYASGPVLNTFLERPASYGSGAVFVTNVDSIPTRGAGTSMSVTLDVIPALGAGPTSDFFILFGVTGELGTDGVINGETSFLVV